jgi:hypothetical protein
MILLFIVVFCIFAFTAYHFVKQKKNKEHFALFSKIYNKESHRFDCLSHPFSPLFNYCIYLPEREDYIRDLFMQFNLQNICFFKGIEPSHLQPQDYISLSQVRNPSNKMYTKESKLCVHLSYMMCILHAIQHDREYILLFEDDIYFTQPYSEIYNVYLEFKNSDYDVCYIGFCSCKKCNQFLDNSSRLTLLPPNQSILCKHAIMYKTAYLKKIFYDLLPLHENSDRLFIRIHHKYDAKLCIVNKPFIFQDRIRFKSRNYNNGRQSLFT